MLRLTILLGATLVLCPSPASAHQTAFGDDFSAVLHFRPDDQPASGELAEIRLLDIHMADTNFRVDQCDCTLEIWQTGRRLSALPLHAIGDELGAQYKFPSAGNYQLHLIARPTNAATFRPRTLGFTQPVVAGAANTTNDRLVLAGGAGLLAIMTFAAIFLLRSPRRQQPPV